jgi:hypothetical protein
MLVEAPPPLPFGGVIWVGGYWVWEGSWIWAAGRWAPPPQPGYGWVHPYYEHRGNVVVFVTGHWSPPGVAFVPPPYNRSFTVVTAAPGVRPGAFPNGPQGVFVPPPPGSRPGLIVPAPVGTPPAAVISAPPVNNPGMHIQGGVASAGNNAANLTIVAPGSATASGRAFQSSVPALAHLAAALPAMVHAQAPMPIHAQPIQSFVPNRPPLSLPPSQPVQAAITPVWQTHLNNRPSNAAAVTSTPPPGPIQAPASSPVPVARPNPAGPVPVAPLPAVSQSPTMATPPHVVIPVAAPPDMPNANDRRVNARPVPPASPAVPAAQQMQRQANQPSAAQPPANARRPDQAQAAKPQPSREHHEEKGREHRE